MPGSVAGAWEADADDGVPRFRGDHDLTMVAVGDDPPRDVETEPGALADVLGREERLERTRLHLGRHAGTVICDLDHHELGFGASRDPDRAVPIDGVDGVGD